MNMNRDIDITQLVADNKYLENQNKHLRQAMWDDLFKAALTGMSASPSGYSAPFIALRAVEIANEAFVLRRKIHDS